MGWAIRDSIPSREKRYVSVLQNVQTDSRSHPISFSIGTGCSFFVSKAGEAHHLPPSGAEVTNEWSCASTPSCAFVVCAGTTLLFPLPLKHDVYYT